MLEEIIKELMTVQEWWANNKWECPSVGKEGEKNKGLKQL